LLNHYYVLLSWFSAALGYVQVGYVGRYKYLFSTVNPIVAKQIYRTSIMFVVVSASPARTVSSHFDDLVRQRSLTALQVKWRFCSFWRGWSTCSGTSPDDVCLYSRLGGRPSDRL